MKWVDVFNAANIKANDNNLPLDILIIFANQGISNLNNDCYLKLPLISEKLITDDNNEINFSNEDFVNNIIGNMINSYICFCLLQRDGMENNRNPFYSEYLASKLEFRSKFLDLIKDEFKIQTPKSGEKQNKIKRFNFGNRRLF